MECYFQEVPLLYVDIRIGCDSLEFSILGQGVFRTPTPTSISVLNEVYILKS